MRLQGMIFGMIFLGIGISFFMGKAIPMLKGWQNLPEEKKACINVSYLGRNAGLVFLSVGSIFELMAWVPGFREKAFLWCMILWFILTGAIAHDMNKSQRYLIKTTEEEQEVRDDKERE